MKPWLLTALVGLPLLAVAGCRSNSAIPILERQLRLQEDEIYRLRQALEESQCSGSTSCGRTVDNVRPDEPEDRAPRTLRRRRASNGGETPPAVELPSQPSTEVPEALKEPGDRPVPGVPEVPKELQSPSKPIEPHSSSRRDLPPGADQGDGPAFGQGPNESAARSGRIAMASRSGAEPFAPRGDSRHVASIALDRMLTGGISSESSPGDQGLLVVVEPRDRSGRTVDAPAEMSIVVIDPALEGDAARVARWDFTTAETAAMFRRTSEGRAIHVTTAWPAEPPSHHQLHLFVRYVTIDGRKLQADQPIDVALPGDKTARRPAEKRPDRVDSARRPDTPAARVAARPDRGRPSRPVWSPERQ